MTTTALETIVQTQTPGVTPTTRPTATPTVTPTITATVRRTVEIPVIPEATIQDAIAVTVPSVEEVSAEVVEEVVAAEVAGNNLKLEGHEKNLFSRGFFSAAIYR